MDEEKGIGNIVFYIIAAIIAIISALKSKKKQQQGMPETSSQRDTGPGGFPDDLFDDDVEGAQYPGSFEEKGYNPPPVYSKRPEPVMVDKEVVKGEPMAEMVSNEGVSAFNHYETAKRFEELLKESSIPDYDWSEDEAGVTSDIDPLEEILTGDFDGPRAVIYAEILNRKEY